MPFFRGAHTALLLRPAARAAFAGAAAYALVERKSLLEEANSKRFSELPPAFASQGHSPTIPYPGWDYDWDRLTLDNRAIAKELGHSWPINDYAEAIRKLFVEHYRFTEKGRYKSLADVEKAIKRRREKGELAEFYREAYMRHAWGGAPVRHVILVRPLCAAVSHTRQASACSATHAFGSLGRCGTGSTRSTATWSGSCRRRWAGSTSSWRSGSSAART